MKKQCRGCGEKKPLEMFNKARKGTGERTPRGGMGVSARCKRCIRIARDPDLDKRKTEEKRLFLLGMKKCSACSEVKRVDDFSKRKASPDGLCYKCKECSSKYKSQWDQLNPGSFKRWYQENRESRSGYWSLWYERNKPKRLAYVSLWSKENKPIVNANIAARNAAKLKASVAWADKDKIISKYDEARRKTKDTGIPHEVDHIYPLRGKLVSGLHCEHNLQVLTKAENLKKGNTAPEEFYGGRYSENVQR